MGHCDVQAASLMHESAQACHPIQGDVIQPFLPALVVAEYRMYVRPSRNIDCKLEVCAEPNGMLCKWPTVDAVGGDTLVKELGVTITVNTKHKVPQQYMRFPHVDVVWTSHPGVYPMDPAYHNLLTHEELRTPVMIPGEEDITFIRLDAGVVQLASDMEWVGLDIVGMLEATGAALHHQMLSHQRLHGVQSDLSWMRIDGALTAKVIEKIPMDGDAAIEFRNTIHNREQLAFVVSEVDIINSGALFMQKTDENPVPVTQCTDIGDSLVAGLLGRGKDQYAECVPMANRLNPYHDTGRAYSSGENFKYIPAHGVPPPSGNSAESVGG